MTAKEQALKLFQELFPSDSVHCFANKETMGQIESALLEAERRGMLKAAIDSVLEMFKDYEKAYSAKIFPEVPMSYVNKHAKIITGASGRMGRTLIQNLTRQIKDLRAESEKGTK